MRDLIEVTLSVLSVVALIAAAGRWLISVYYNQAGKLASLEKRLTDESLFSLEEIIKVHSKTIQDHKDILLTTDKDLKYVSKHLSEIKDDLKSYSSKTDKYINEIDRRMSVLEAITENLKILRAPKK